MSVMRMEDVEAQVIRLWEELGPRAIATAAQRAAEAEQAGQTDAGEAWRRVEERLKERRGARQG